ncbi:MAG TPA: MOSC domain-containing protein [Candidatus Acidoferrales bacterium]|nr:MOSC domain-containing protein [Candidatus Acidoferrales bacterium]
MSGPATGTKLGTLRALRRYPFKSMAGEDLAEVFVAFSGLVGDRAYAFVDRNNHSNFPWMTARQSHEMLLFRPRFLAPPNSANEHPSQADFAAEVVTPEGETLRPSVSSFTPYFEERFGRQLELRFSERAMQDACPVSLLGLATVKSLSDEAGMPLEHTRFRANFYIDWDNGKPYYEDELVGTSLRIGEKFTFTVVQNNLRCAIITLDPDTAQASPEVGKLVARNHGNCFGVYGSVLREGIVRQGDSVFSYEGTKVK